MLLKDVGGPAIVPQAALDGMTSALHHRGPDDAGTELGDGWGLAHTRLAIVDPTPTGHQPMWSADRTACIVYNGEVYNHLALRRRYLSDMSFRGGSDTETIVELYARRGLADLDSFEGIFAFAVLDARRRLVHLVRDGFGIKPLYIGADGDRLVFGSEVRAVLAGGIAPRPRLDALAYALERGWVHGPTTVYDGIRRVEPGTTTTVALGSLSTTQQTWYDPATLVAPDIARELRARSREQNVDHVEHLLRRAVSAQLMADVPLGTMCSGGIDSSLVTAFARDELPHVHAFNVSIRDQPDSDESAWAEAVAQHLDVELHTIELDGERWLDGLVPAVAHFEYPLTYEASVGLAALAQRARRAGVKVLLSGEGADEVLAGYPWLHRQAAADFAAPLPSVEWARRVASSGLRRTGLRADEERVLGSGPCADANEYVRTIGAQSAAAYGHHRGSRRRFESALLGDFRLSLPQILARGDKNTMQHSIETRVPFLDPKLVAMCVNLPLEHRVEPHLKNPLVVLAERHLPKGLATRPKIGFNFDVEHYLGERTRPEFLNSGLLRDLLGLHGAHWRSRLRLAPYRESMLLWTAEIWARLFLAGDTEDAVAQAMLR